MVLICCVKACKSESYLGCGISFLKVPKNEEIKQKWINAVPGYVTKYSVVCGLPVLGLIVDTYSFAGLADDLLQKNAYFLTHKCSQDHLEMLFSCIRARGGSDDNPNALQFKYIMRKLLFRNSIRPSVNANCTDSDYEMTPILEFRSSKRKEQSVFVSKSQSGMNDEAVKYIDDLMKQAEKTSDFKNNIMYYISGLYSK